MKFIVFAIVCVSVAVARPGLVKRQSEDGEPVPRFTPAVAPATLYIRPLFDREGRIIQDEDLQEKETPRTTVAPTTTTTTTTTVPTTTTTTEQSTNQRRLDALRRLQQRQEEAEEKRRQELADAAAKRQRPDELDLFDEVSQIPVATQEELSEIQLPTFSRPETILKATKELKQLDRNQVQFIQTTGANAGVLPLAFEDRRSLSLFPPLRPAIRLPKEISL